MAQLINEAKRMQRLAGIITESEYVSSLEENLWDRIKNIPKRWIAKAKGGAPAILAAALKDMGLPIGKPIYFYGGSDKLYMIEIKSINYDTGAVEIDFQKSTDNGKTFTTDDAEGLNRKLDIEEDFSKLSNMSEEELKAWYDKTVLNGKKEFSKERENIDYTFNLKDIDKLKK
jgi:hypothetical protein